ncbi:hypothetical protein IFM89_018462 [Coptis chinensis]|uniref:PPM-type phosphatase domain-containing protein n=1 Tax=Coptis chinensis TaxID=261450 RepID=A0A835LHP5_9MAGN|nr:hypothetical protein IFM89_018462 [Coptis chinensis]
MSVGVIREAYSATEEEFLCLVQKEWLIKPQMPTVGSCCLVGITCAGTLYIANVGKSRVVLGRSEKASMDVTAIQLSAEHDAKSLCTRSFNCVNEKPMLSSEPSVLVQKLHPRDEFLIFASDGLWEHLSNEQAVEIVHRHPRKGIARRLIQAASQEMAKKREMRYSHLKNIERGVRRHFHDDITVIVLFLDSIPSSTSSSYQCSKILIRGGGKWSELGFSNA